MANVHREDDLRISLEEALKIAPNNEYALFALGWFYARQKNYPEAKRLFNRLIELNPKHERAYRSLHLLHEHLGDNMAIEKKLIVKKEYYAEATQYNYKKLKEILDQRDIKLVCVQYPMRPIEPLKKIFAAQEGVVFVDNEDIFKRAVKGEGYKEYFTDMFAGDFGHCTPRGNKLLAENISRAILKKYFSK